MTQTLDFSLLPPAELLTYLVISQLASHHTSGRWLTDDRLVESAFLWTRFNGGESNCLQRMALGRRTKSLAARYVERPSEMTFEPQTVAGIFFDGVRLNFQSAAVAEVYLICLNDLIVS